MKIKLNGDIVENTDSIKNYKPRMRPGYKGKWEASQDNNKVLLISLALMIFMCFGISIGSDIRVKQYKDDLAALESVRQRELSIAYDNIVAYNELLTEYASVSAKLNSKTFKGKVSYYSHDGCLGCGEKQITASGEPFDENKYTMAIPVEWKHIKMGTMATATNLDNGKSITVKINDRGGFLKYGRVADLSKAAYIALGAETDKSTIQITWY